MNKILNHGTIDIVEDEKHSSLSYGAENRVSIHGAELETLENAGRGLCVIQLSFQLELEEVLTYSVDLRRIPTN